MGTENIFNNVPANFQDEIFDKILENKNVRIERIISKGHSSSKNFWYDQNENEWVIVLKGSARLLIEGEAESVQLNAGDYLNLKAHQKHRVEYTDPETETIWLAVFY